MPNWTRNWITYTGPKEDLDKVKDLMGEEFDFNKLCEHWGTKWPAHDVCMKEGTNEDGKPTLSYDFSTAWSAPFPVIEALERKFPEIEYEFWYENEDDWEHSYGVRYIPNEFDDDDEEE